jgi:hypothetical protein
MVSAWIVLMACGLQPSGQQSGVDYELDPNIDRSGSGSGDAFVYPPDFSKTVLLYTGHGGEKLRGSPNLESLWTSMGWSVETASAWPTSFEGIRLFMMLKVGSRALSEDEAKFDDDQIAKLSDALADGVRVVIAQPASSTGCQAPALLSLLDEGFGAPVFVGWQTGGSMEAEVFEVQLPDAQPMSGVNTLSLTNPCRLSPTDGALARNADDVPVIAQFRPDIAGDLILVGDVGMFEGEALNAEDNRTFAVNLAAVVPD